MKKERENLGSPQAYSLRSQIKGRKRVNCSGLIDSTPLRNHCVITLTRCHWLKDFRINRINGDLILLYPSHREKDITALLNECLYLPSIDRELESALANLKLEKWSTKLRHSAAARNGIFAGSFLLCEILFPIPTAIMAIGAAIALMPIAAEITEHWRRHRKLSPEILEFVFSGILITKGHAGEALLDSGLGNISDTVEEFAKNQSAPNERSQEFVEKIRNIISLQIKNSDDQDANSIIAIRRGATYRGHPQSHVFVNSTLLTGELIVIKRIVDGDWRPHKKQPGDSIEAGSLIIKGSGILRIEETIEEHDAYMGIIQSRTSKLSTTKSEKILDRYNDIATPVLLGLGGLTMLLGGLERSLGILQFDPFNAWTTSNISSKFTAIYALGVQGVHIHAPDSLYALSKVRNVVISCSCLDRLGGIKTKEHLMAIDNCRKGELLRILAGLQNYLLEENEVRIWSNQLDHVEDPAVIIHAELNDLCGEGWQLKLKDGRELLVKEQVRQPAQTRRTHLDPLEIWEGKALLGYVELMTEPGDGWVGVCEALMDMGIDIHVVGSDSKSQMMELVKPLGIDTDKSLHGNCDAFDRLELVRDLQKSGGGVAYLGYVVHDLPALTHADVSICLDVDADSAITGSICDITLGADVHWLPRIMQASRNIEKTANSNFLIITASSLIAAIGATTAAFNPLTTVLLSNIPALIAEIRNLLSLKTQGVYESHYNKERAPIPPLPIQHPSCRIPLVRLHSSIA